MLMNLHFSISYRAQWGEDVCVELALIGTRGREVPLLLHMETSDGIVWRTDYRVMETGIRQFRYSYAVYRGMEVVRREWHRAPRLFDADAGRDFILDDFWMDTPSLPWLFFKDFNAGAARDRNADLHTPTFAQTIVLRVLAPTLSDGEAVALIGSQPPLGDWKPERALRLTFVGLCEWRIAVSATALQLPFEYKYVIVDEQTGELLRWEDGYNRVCWPVSALATEPVGKADSGVKLSNSRLLTIVRNDGIVRQREDGLWHDGDVAVVTDGDSADVAAEGDYAAVAVAVDTKKASPLQVLVARAQERGVASVSLGLLEDVLELM